MIVAAFDISTRTGYAIGPGGGTPTFGVWALPEGPLGLRMSALANAIEIAIARFGVQKIVVESGITSMAHAKPRGNKPAPTNIKTIRLLACLVGVSEMVAVERKIPWSECAASTARTSVLGKSRFSHTDPLTGERKSDVKAHVVKWAQLAGYQTHDHDAADALVLWEHITRIGELWRAEHLNRERTT